MPENHPLNEVERLIDELESFADQPSKWFWPGSQGLIFIKDEDFFRITTRLREALPSELVEARATLEKRDLIMRNAQEEHKRILDTAERRLEDLLSEEQVVIAAEAEAQRIVERAHGEGEQIKRDALAYTAELLEDMEKQFNQTLSTIQKGRRFLETELGRGEAPERNTEAAGTVQ
jgi:F0F1-type ATP synthase membrane subunit b/b'